MSRRFYCIVNPASGSAGGRESLREAKALAGLDVTWLETTADDPGPGQAREALDGGADTIVAMGGDGTIRAVLEATAGSGVPIAVVPAGTGNLLAGNLRIPADAHEALETAVNGRDRKLDVGYVNDEAFVVMAGTGVDAAMIRDADPAVKRWLGKLAYVRSALVHLRDAQFPATVEVDGEEVFSGRVSTVLVANMGKVLAGIDLFPDGSPDDGRLDVAVVRSEGWWHWVLLAVRVLLRRGPDNRRLHVFSGREVVVRLARPRPYQVDGEERPAAGELRCRIEPGGLVVRVPA